MDRGELAVNIYAKKNVQSIQPSWTNERLVNENFFLCDSTENISSSQNRRIFSVRVAKHFVLPAN